MTRRLYLIASRLWSTEGSSFVELALMLPIMMLLFVPAVDIGRAFFTAIEVTSAAQAGTDYGIKNPSDVSGMESASLKGATNLATLSSTATYGCECSDGTSAVASCSSTPSCTYNYVSYVDVVTTATYVPTFNYPGLPSSLKISKESRLRVGGN
jgi:Flp pilus assembly protein TadG